MVRRLAYCGSRRLENLAPSDIHVKRFKHEKIAQEGYPSFPYADGILNFFDHPQTQRGEILARETLSKLEKQT